jgi:CRISPR-associated protein Csm1
MSRSIDYIFSGYLNTIRQEFADDTSIIIYSGGLDLFSLLNGGSHQLAKQNHTDSKEFACGNPAFSVSGAIAILPPKFRSSWSKESDDEGRQRQNASRTGGITTPFPLCRLR